MPASKRSQRAATTEPPPKPKKLPEKKIGPFNAGIGATVWLNTIHTDGGARLLRSITINPRRYFDQESQQWRDAPSFNPADLPALIFALTKAQEYCYETPLPDQLPLSEGGNSASVPTDGEEIPF